MIFLFLLPFALIFTFVTLRNITYGACLLLLLLPTYLIRFSYGVIPTTLLEMMLWIFFAVWIFQYLYPTKERKKIIDFYKNFWKKNKIIVIATALFLFGATLSLFTAVDLRTAAGEWKAFYVEPIIFFIILLPLFAKHKSLPKKLAGVLLLSGLLTAILAVYQHVTGWLVPDAFWANRNTFRVTGWYGFPNAVGLFLAPLVPLALWVIYDSLSELRYKKNTAINIMYMILAGAFIPIAMLAVFFAKSTGGLIGITAAIGLLLFIYKKTRWPIIAIGIVGGISLFILPVDNPIRQELTLQDRSGQIRISMWHESFQLLHDRPFFGAGLASYDERIRPYHTTVNGEGIEIFHHPHNIFMTIWHNTSLIGLAGFIMIIAWYFSSGLTYQYNQKNKSIIFLTAILLTIVTTGLVDSPYIKNDLSLLFWFFIAWMAYEIQQTYAHPRSAS